MIQAPGAGPVCQEPPRNKTFFNYFFFFFLGPATRAECDASPRESERQSGRTFSSPSSTGGPAAAGFKPSNLGLVVEGSIHCATAAGPAAGSAAVTLL